MAVVKVVDLGEDLEGWMVVEMVEVVEVVEMADKMVEVK